MGDSLTRELLLEGAFEGEHREFEPGEYYGVAEIAQKLHQQTGALSNRPEDDLIRRLPRATDGEPMTKEQQTPIVESLKNNPDRVWHMDAFEKDGKYNCLRITPAGQVFLDVIKPGVQFSRIIQLAGTISQEEITTLRENIMRKPEEWQKKLEQGFLIAGETEHSAESKFDNEKGGTRPGAIFVADRFLDLGVIKDTQKLILRWIVKHTNPVKEGEAFKVEDIVSLEWESLPTH